MLSMGWTFSSQGKKKRSRSARRDSSDEELCEENKSQRMSKISPKKKGGEKEKKSSKLVKPKNAYENFINSKGKNRKPGIRIKNSPPIKSKITNHFKPASRLSEASNELEVEARGEQGSETSSVYSVDQSS